MTQATDATSKPLRGIDRPEKDAPTVLANLLSVVRYLEDRGWSVTKSTLYRHAAEGRLKPDRSGRYPAPAADRYARRHLTRPGQGTKDAATDGGDEERAASRTAETRLRLAQAEAQEHRLAILRGAYILRAEVDRQFTGRLAILRADAEQSARQSAAAIASQFALGSAGEAEISELLLGRVEAWLARYAEPIEFEIPATAPKSEVLHA